MISHVQSSTAGLLRALLIGLTAFLTVVDLFATQAILPALTHAYGTTPAVMSLAVNASTIGMAISGLAMALIGHRVDRRLGILFSLALLSVPTLLLATMPNLVVFAGLRVVQGLLMASAFTLTLAYIGETSTPAGHRNRLRCLHHRQCRKQSVRSAAVGSGGRSSRPGVELLCIRGTQPVRRLAGVYHDPGGGR